MHAVVTIPFTMIANRTFRGATPAIKQCVVASKRQASRSCQQKHLSTNGPLLREARSEAISEAGWKWESDSVNKRLLTCLVAGGFCWLYYSYTNSPADAEAARSDDDTIITLDRVLSQQGQPHTIQTMERTVSVNAATLQAKISWENPGVYAWGLNSGRVVAPNTEERWVKTPRRISYFDGVVLRDLKLGKTVGAAINEKGDLLQWGNGYAPNTKTPQITLKGKNLRSLVLSEDRIVALGDNGSVYSIPSSKKEQNSAPKYRESSWFWSSATSVGCRSVTPQNLGMGEKVVSIAGGLEHVLMLTSRGRVYSAASSTKDFPRHGQLGIPGLGWYTRPPGPFDQPHEILSLKGLTIKQIAAGDTHSVVLDDRSRVFSFGDNSHGQLGIPLNVLSMNLDNPLNINPHTSDAPVQVPINPLYASTQEDLRVKSIAAGGQNTYFVIESTRVGSQISSSPQKLPDVSSDAWACGRGIWGTLGVGKWIHVQWGPVKITSLSGMFEYNEKTQKPEPIRIGTFKVGESHVAAIMDNITSVSAKDSHWGSDVYFFGNNQSFQLGTGKRNNLALPSHIKPLGIKLDGSTEGLETDRFQLTPAKKVTVAGRSVQVEQRIECGRQNSAVYSAAI
jgi:alpha-tubulin suppressor-like RCC1 family protein